MFLKKSVTLLHKDLTTALSTGGYLAAQTLCSTYDLG